LPCDIAIRDGRIVALGHDLGAAETIIDATDRLVLPRRQSTAMFTSPSPRATASHGDGFAQATRSAAFGGNTTVLPFCLQQKGQTLREALRNCHAQADGECHVDVAFHLIVTDPTDQVLGQELPALVQDGYTSLKVFMTYEGMALSDRELLETMAVARETGAVLMVHAENFRLPSASSPTASNVPATPRRAFMRPRDRSRSSVRPRIAPFRFPNSSTCRS